LLIRFGRQCEHAADVHACPGCLVDTGIRITEDDRTVGEAVVDVLVIVEIDDSRTLAALDVNRLVVTPVTEVRRHAERQLGNRFFKMRIGICQAPHRLPQAGAQPPGIGLGSHTAHRVVQKK
jgi:hypothetical protein